MNGLYKAEVIHRWSWRNLQDVELATTGVGGLVQPQAVAGAIGDIPPAEGRSELLLTDP